MVDVSLLKSRVSGPVLTRDDAAFADEVKGWLLNEEHNPEIAVGAASADDVVEAVKFAVANGLVVRAQGTGHGSEVPIQDGILITTKRLDTVTIDKATRIATIGAGLAWSSVVEAAAPLGLLAITGSSSTVGAVGLLLGGGMGPLARSHGFSSDWVRGFELVTGDGELVRADANTNPDLFWALRGGKGGLGIVTEVDVELVDLPTIYGGSLSFDAPDIAAALRAWVKHLPDLDPDVTTSVALVRVPDLPFIPEPVRGHTLLNVRFAYPGDVATGEKLAAPLRAAAPVYLDALGELGCGDLDAIHGDPKEPSVGWISARLLSNIDEEFCEMLLRFVGPDKQVPFVAVEVRAMGSATERDVPEGSATSGRDGKGTLTIVGAPNPELFATVVPGAAAAVFDAALPWRSSENLINFAPPSTSEAEYEAIWPRETFDRLQQVRKKYDPKGTFAFFR